MPKKPTASSAKPAPAAPPPAPAATPAPREKRLIATRKPSAKAPPTGRSSAPVPDSATPASLSKRATPQNTGAAAAKRRISGKSRPAASPTFEEISLRAYFISEQRQREGRHAEPGEDWAEAERQLLAEGA